MSATFPFLLAMGAGHSTVRDFKVEWPAGAGPGEIFVLRISGLNVPASFSGQLRLEVVDRLGDRSVVGTVPLVALAEDAPGTVTHRSVPVVISARTSRALVGSTALHLRITPLDTQGRPVASLHWDLESVKLERR